MSALGAESHVFESHHSDIFEMSSNEEKLKYFLNELNTRNKYIKNIKKELFNKQNLNYIKFLENSDIDIINYLVNIKFTRTNTFLSICAFSGKSRYFYSAGNFFQGKQKTARSVVLKKIFQLLQNDFSFLNKESVCLQLINAGSYEETIIDYLEKKMLIRLIQIINIYPHNGCRKKKIKNKKLNKNLMV